MVYALCFIVCCSQSFFLFSESSIRYPCIGVLFSCLVPSTLCARDCSIMYNFLGLPYSPSLYSFPFFFVKQTIPLESSIHVLFNCIC